MGPCFVRVSDVACRATTTTTTAAGRFDVLDVAPPRVRRRLSRHDGGLNFLLQLVRPFLNHEDRKRVRLAARRAYGAMNAPTIWKTPTFWWHWKKHNASGFPFRRAVRENLVVSVPDDDAASLPLLNVAFHRARQFVLRSEHDRWINKWDLQFFGPELRARLPPSCRLFDLWPCDPSGTLVLHNLHCLHQNLCLPMTAAVEAPPNQIRRLVLEEVFLEASGIADPQHWSARLHTWWTQVLSSVTEECAISLWRPSGQRVQNALLEAIRDNPTMPLPRHLNISLGRANWEEEEEEEEEETAVDALLRRRVTPDMDDDDDLHRVLTLHLDRKVPRSNIPPFGRYHHVRLQIRSVMMPEDDDRRLATLLTQWQPEHVLWHVFGPYSSFSARCEDILHLLRLVPRRRTSVVTVLDEYVRQSHQPESNPTDVNSFTTHLATVNEWAEQQPAIVVRYVARLPREDDDALCDGMKKKAAMLLWPQLTFHVEQYGDGDPFSYASNLCACSWDGTVDHLRYRTTLI